MIAVEIRLYLESWLKKQDSSAIITKVKPVHGGSINETFMIETSSRSYFIKYNLAQRFPGMFQAEALGLSHLEASACLSVPKVQHFAETGQFAFLLLEYIQEGIQDKNYWQILGNRLAALHSKTHTLFGFGYNNYIGSLFQSNQHNASWIKFLINERFQPQMKISVDSGLLDFRDVHLMEHLCKKLPEIIPEEPPSLLHGDLWSGNIMTDAKGYPCIFDPAVYYGNREMDIGMTKLFGGFSKEFYEAYQESYPMEKGWEKRVEINQLYPLLVHVNLFGRVYTEQVRQILRRF